jgi:hypothetical protein
MNEARAKAQKFYDEHTASDIVYALENPALYGLYSATLTALYKLVFTAINKDKEAS